MNWSEFFKTGALVQIDPERYWVGIGPFSFKNNASHSFSAIFTSDFFLADPHPWKMPQSAIIVTRDELSDAVREFLPESSLDWQPADFHHFSAQFLKIKNSIAEGEIQKAVPVTFERAEGKPCLPSLLKRAVQAPRNLWAYGYWNEEGGMLGLTPEILFAQKQRRLEVYALAGTRPAADAERLPLLADAKELKEHSLVVEALHNRLSSFGAVHVGACEVMSLPKIEHLKTVVSVELNAETKFADLVKALHPTPALGTWPPEKGLKYLARIDDKHGLRGKFGAPFGVWLPDGQMLCLVAIRNIQWDEKGSFLFSGCGVVEQSELEREWLELALKRQSVKDLLGLEK